MDSVNITESKNTKLTNNTNTAFDFVLDSSLAGFFGFCKASEWRSGWFYKEWLGILESKF